MEKTTQRFQKIATTLADLNAEGLNAQAVNDPLTTHAGAASQHVLRMSFVPEQECYNFDTGHDLLVPPHSTRHHLSAVFSTSQTWRTWCKSPPSKETSSSKSLTASPTHLLNAPCSHRKPPHTLVLLQPSSEAYEAEDRCFRVSVARRLMLPHPAAPNATDVVQSCPNKVQQASCPNKAVDTQQHHCYGCRYGGGVDRRPAAAVRCLADVIFSQSGAKVFIEQEVPALTRVVNGHREHARMDLVFNLNGSVTYLDVSIVAPFSCTSVSGLSSQQKKSHMARRAEKGQLDRYPHINLVPFILETTGRPVPHARKFISNLMRDADNPPLAIRDTWSAVQSVLCSAFSKQQLTAAAT